MKESDITPKVIELSKEIVKYWRMEIYEGCWFYWEDYKFGEKDKIRLFDDKFFKIRKFFDPHDFRLSIPGTAEWDPTEIKKWFPIPSIADCLEKLREKYYLLPSNWKGDLEETFFNILNYDISISKFHEALLSALLEVLKKERGR